MLSQICDGLREGEEIPGVLAWAKRYCLSYGLSVVPIAPRLKRTPDGFGWKSRQRVRMTETEIEKSFRDGDWLGFIAGVVSGNVEVLDFDDGEIFERWWSLLEETGRAEVLDKLVVERTPRGGSHCYYRCSGLQGNQRLAARLSTPEELLAKRSEKTKVTIETRGEGGLIVCSPSPGYRLVQGSFGELRSISAGERDELLAAARSFDEAHEARREFAAGDSDGKPGQEYNRTASWAELLGRYGWQFVREFGGRGYWRRPGKGESWSATTGNGPQDLLYMFSSSASPFEPGRAYSKFAAYALLEFGGDFSKCAQSLAKGMPAGASPVPPSNGRMRVFPRRRWSEIRNRGPKPMLIRGLIGVGDSAMIVGKRKGGKTFAATDLMIGAVAGLPFARTFHVVRPLKIAYFTTEGTGSIHDRIAAVQDSLIVPDEFIEENFHYFEAMPQLFDGNAKFRIEEFVRDWEEFEKEPLDLMVIDTLSKAVLGAEENSNSEMSQALATLARARSVLGCASLLIHHHGKNGEMRGASSIDGDLDLQLVVEHDEATKARSLTFGFAKDMGGFEPMPFELIPHLNAMRVSWKNAGAPSAARVQDAGTVLKAVIGLMVQRPFKNSWTLAQIREALPAYTRQAIHSAIGREIDRGELSSIIRQEPTGSGVHTYSLRSNACVNEE